MVTKTQKNGSELVWQAAFVKHAWYLEETQPNYTTRMTTSIQVLSQTYINTKLPEN